MDITRRCDYACRILRSAFRHGSEYVSISEISAEESIPYAFARGIQHDLAIAGFLETARGSRGGIRLAKDPAKITMYDVITAVQGEVNMSACSLDTGVCDKCDRCDYRRVWLSSDRLLQCFYRAITLQELFELGNDHPVIRAIMGNDSEEAGRMLAKILKRPAKPIDTIPPHTKTTADKSQNRAADPLIETVEVAPEADRINMPQAIS